MSSCENGFGIKYTMKVNMLLNDETLNTTPTVLL